MTKRSREIPVSCGADNRRGGRVSQFVVARGDAVLGLRTGDHLTADTVTGDMTVSRQLRFLPGHLHSLIVSGMLMPIGSGARKAA